jgi:hypothetical protein
MLYLLGLSVIFGATLERRCRCDRDRRRLAAPLGLLLGVFFPLGITLDWRAVCTSFRGPGRSPAAPASSGRSRSHAGHQLGLRVVTLLALAIVQPASAPWRGRKARPAAVV